MKPKALLSLAAALIAVIVTVFFPKLAGNQGDTPAGEEAPAAVSAADPRGGSESASQSKPNSNRDSGGKHSSIGFGSTRAFDDHYEKHGAEFGSISQAEYLSLAQALRDAPVGGPILEAVRDDGVISRFDKRSGGFVAFNKNKTIRTFFKPNDGVRYFERQIDKEH
ncbi:MAG: hypothetical protein JNL28_10300 [Planctomycetes bacterium]|nr:hypothetical protein [Planctomycetota bacterium]